MAIQRLDHVNFITHDLNKTIAFYTDIIGLEYGDKIPADKARSIYFYIRGQNYPVLHVGYAPDDKKQPRFSRLADLDDSHKGQFSTGSLDHFCLAVDAEDYQQYIARLDKQGIEYQCYCHSDLPLKQIWVLDPNGVRVELNFIGSNQ